MPHNAQALIATRIDYRLQDEIAEWISENFEDDTYDRVALAGDVKFLDAILGQVKIAHDLHHIKKVVFINHEDCGAYGADGTFEKHVHDLKKAKEEVIEKYPEVEVETYYLHLNGEFEKV